ncbi:MAG: hypothetical protein JWM16_3317 [Verrucomicrobiales bacterium]|nr:hypothetical protein [Verrucomicrobiales bacterium]
MLSFLGLKLIDRCFVGSFFPVASPSRLKYMKYSMQHLRRILALLFLFFGWKSSQGQPLPSNNQQAPNAVPQSAASPDASAPNKSALPPQDPNPPSLAVAMKEYKMNAEQEAKARALLDQALNTDKTRQAAAAPSAILIQPEKTVPVLTAAKSDDEAAREREIARIEGEVLKARQRREGLNPSTASASPSVPVTVTQPAALTTPSGVVPTQLPQQNAKAAMDAAQEAKARTLLDGDRPENMARDDVPASNPALRTNLSYEQEKKARSLLRADFVVMGSDNPAAQVTPPQVTSVFPAPVAAPLGGIPATQLPVPLTSAPQAPAPVFTPQPLPATPLPAPIQLAQVIQQPVAPVVVPTAPGRAALAPPPVAVLPTQSTLTPDKEAQARELLRQASLALGATAPSAAPAPSAPVPLVAPAPMIVPQTPAPGSAATKLPAVSYSDTAPVAPILGNDQETKARLMLRGMLRDNRMDVVGTQPAVTPQPAKVNPVPPPVAAVAPVPAPAPAPAPIAAVPAPVVNPAAPASAQKLQPIETTSAAPGSSVAAMSLDQEAKARDLLKQATGRQTYSPSPVVTHVPTIAPVTPPPVAPVAIPPTLTATPGKLTPDQEAKARDLLLQLREQRPPATAVNPPVATIATPQPAVVVTPPPVAIVTPPPAVAVNPPPATIPNVPPVAQPATVPGVTMTPEQEAKARALLTDVSGTVFTPANHPAQPSNPKLAAEDAKLRAKAEAQARKEMDRMQEEAKVKARDEMRKQSDAEARARKESEEANAAIRNRERDEIRRRTQAETDSGLIAKTRPVTPIPAETRPAVSSPQQATAQAEAVNQSKTAAPVKTALRPEDDPAVPLAKRQRLLRLLDDYMHDRVTPAEYHTTRAKIITEP